MTDLTVYTEAGAAFFDGRDPYVVSNVRGWRYVYPPLFAILLAPLHPLDTRLQALIWFLISCGFACGVFVEVRRMLRYVVEKGLLGGRGGGAPPAWIIGPAGFVAVLAALAALQRGQVDLMISYALWLGLRMVWTGKAWPAWLFGGILLAVPVSIKLTPVVAVGFLCLQLALLALRRREGRPRALGVSSGLALGMALWLFIAPSLLVGWRANVGYLVSWRDRVALVAAADRPSGGMDRRSYRNQSLSNAAYRFGNYVAYELGRGPDDRLASDTLPRGTMPMDHPAFSKALDVVRGLLLLALLLAGLRLTLRRELGGLAAFGLACSATLLVSPVSWPYHHVLWLPALLFVPLWLYGEGRDRAAAAMAWIPCGLVIAHAALFSVAGRLGLQGLGHAAWFVAAVALAVSGRACKRTDSHVAVSQELKGECRSRRK